MRLLKELLNCFSWDKHILVNRSFLQIHLIRRLCLLILLSGCNAHCQFHWSCIVLWVTRVSSFIIINLDQVHYPIFLLLHLPLSRLCLSLVNSQNKVLPIWVGISLDDMFDFQLASAPFSWLALTAETSRTHDLDRRLTRVLRDHSYNVVLDVILLSYILIKAELMRFRVYIRKSWSLVSWSFVTLVGLSFNKIYQTILVDFIKFLSNHVASEDRLDSHRWIVNVLFS